MSADAQDSTPRSGFGSALLRSHFDSWHVALPKVKAIAVGLASVLVAFLIRLLLAPILGEDLPFMLFIAAALVAAWYGGAAIGVGALLLGLLLSDCFFLSDQGVGRGLELVRVLRYLFTASLGVVLIEVLHRSKARTVRALEQLQGEVEQRKRYESQLLEAKAQLGEHAKHLDGEVAKRTVELNAAVTSLQDVLYHVAHNLRAPLRSIEGFTSILLSDSCPSLDTGICRKMTVVRDSAKRMDRLIQDLLRYGKLWQWEVPVAPVSLKQTVEHTLAQLSSRFHATRADVRIQGGLPEVLANPDLLKEALIQILENALIFVAPATAPRVRIWAERCEAVVRLWIEDEGIGIDTRFHDKIFEPFERLSPSHHNGSGIGLALVKQAVIRMGGRVGVESEPCKGSRFWLELRAA